MTISRTRSHQCHRRARHTNSTLDEHADFRSNLSKIKRKDGTTSELFPTSLKDLFSYDGVSPL